MNQPVNWKVAVGGFFIVAHVTLVGIGFSFRAFSDSPN